MLKIRTVILLLIVNISIPYLLKADSGDLCHYSTEGTDFWFGFMENRQTGNVHYCQITVTSRLGATVTITYGPDDEPLETGQVAANSSVKFDIPYSLLEPSGSEKAKDKGIHLVASDPVTVYALNYRTKSSDVAVIYPTKSLGNEYYAMCYTPSPRNNIESNSEFMVVASEDFTNVQITPSVDTDQGKPAGRPFTVTLNKGQLYQVQSMNTSVQGQGDLTGSYISSDKPVAFYSGVKSTAVPFSDLTRDHLFEQIPPLNTWGREFYTVPLKLRGRDTYRILAAEDGTNVKIEGTISTFQLNKGTYKEFVLNSNQACRIIASKRVLLAQYCRSQEADNDNGVGDPFMIIISPVVQKINDITFEAYRSDLITDLFFVNIVTLSAQVNNITLDGNPISRYFKAYADGNYSWAQVPVTIGSHRLKNDDPKGGFLAYVYGFGDNRDTESYGYGVGFNLDIQLEIGGFLETDTLYTCQGNEEKLDAGTYFRDYSWSTKETGSSIIVSKEGWYRVKATTLRGCEKTDSVYLKIERPVMDLGGDKGACLPGEIVLQASAGFKSFEWQDGSTDSSFKVMKTGEYSVTGTTERGCTASDKVNVYIFESAFSQDFTIATDQHSDISFTNETQHGVSYKWDFGDGQTSTDISPVHHYDACGEYQVTLSATSEFGCDASATSTVKIIPFKLLTPNAFRPDSEIEENRVFIPVSEGIDPSRYQLRICSRLGSTIFESTNPAVGWDGRMSNGSSAGPGIYVWILSYSDIQGYNHKDKGTVMLVR